MFTVSIVRTMSCPGSSDAKNHAWPAFTIKCHTHHEYTLVSILGWRKSQDKWKFWNAFPKKTTKGCLYLLVILSSLLDHFKYFYTTSHILWFTQSSWSIQCYSANPNPNPQCSFLYYTHSYTNGRVGWRQHVFGQIAGNWTADLVIGKWLILTRSFSHIKHPTIVLLWCE